MKTDLNGIETFWIDIPSPFYFSLDGYDDPKRVRTLLSGIDDLMKYPFLIQELESIPASGISHYSTIINISNLYGLARKAERAKKGYLEILNGLKEGTDEASLRLLSFALENLSMLRGSGLMGEERARPLRISRSIKERIGDTGLGIATNTLNLSRLYLKLYEDDVESVVYDNEELESGQEPLIPDIGLRSRSLDYGLSAEEAFIEMDNKLGLYHTYLTLGKASEDEEKTPAFFEKAISVSRDLKSKEMELFVLYNLASFYFSYDRKRSMGYVDRAMDLIAITQEADLKKVKEAFLHLKIQILRFDGEYKKSLEFAENELGGADVSSGAEVSKNLMKDILRMEMGRPSEEYIDSFRNNLLAIMGNAKIERERIDPKPILDELERRFG